MQVQVRLESLVARLGHAGHHAVGADRDDAVGLDAAQRRRTQAARRVGLHRLVDREQQRVAKPAARPRARQRQAARRRRITAIHPEPLERPVSAELRRHHFRLLRQGIDAWMAGRTQPRGLAPHAEFVAGVVAALDHVRTHCEGRVLIVSSGGPISAAIDHVLRMAPAATIELNLQIRNSAVTEFTFSPKRHALLTFNTLPHLDSLDAAEWVTYA